MTQVNEATPLTGNDSPVGSSSDTAADGDAAATTTNDSVINIISSFEYGNEVSSYSDLRLFQAFQNTRNLIGVVVGGAIMYLIVGLLACATNTAPKMCNVVNLNQYT